MSEKVTVGNDHEMAQSERKSHYVYVDNTKLTIRYLYKGNIVCRLSSYFQIGCYSDKI